MVDVNRRPPSSPSLSSSTSLSAFPSLREEEPSPCPLERQEGKSACVRTRLSSNSHYVAEATPSCETKTQGGSQGLLATYLAEVPERGEGSPRETYIFANGQIAARDLILRGADARERLSLTTTSVRSRSLSRTVAPTSVFFRSSAGVAGRRNLFRSGNVIAENGWRSSDPRRPFPTNRSSAAISRIIGSLNEPRDRPEPRSIRARQDRRRCQ